MSPETPESQSKQDSPADLAWSSVADAAGQPVARHTVVGHMQIILSEPDLPQLGPEACADLQSVIEEGAWHFTVQSEARVFNLYMHGYLSLVNASGQVVDLPGSDAASTSESGLQESLFPAPAQPNNLTLPTQS